MDQESITEYYKSGYNLSNYHNDLAKTFQSTKKVAEHRLMYIERLGLRHNATILEIGPGSGTLLAMLNSRGYSVVGVEPDQVAATWLKEEKQLNVHEGFFEELMKDGMFERYVGYFDLVVATHVLEHIPKPVEFLRNLRRVSRVDLTYWSYTCKSRQIG
ncbi:MAG: methyltransferase domain-containing protein [Bacteroidetes bacterium]|nr:methyltransferase domain-containing protein [Bacteroidota bacterium]